MPSESSTSDVIETTSLIFKNSCTISFSILGNLILVNLSLGTRPQILPSSLYSSYSLSMSLILIPPPYSLKFTPFHKLRCYNSNILML